MLDLDGVVYVGPDAVPGAAEHLAAVRDAGLRLAFVTNNASRPPATVAEHLSELDVPADVEDVVTSSQAAAGLLHDRLGDGGKVALLGTDGLRVALEQRSLVPVAVDDPDAQAVVSGFGPDVRWSEIMRAAVRVRDGLWWVASNTDMTFPSAFGIAPGHGVLVDTIRRFSGVEPQVAGKPARPLLEETIRRTGAERPLMVGDRLDTDIEGGRNAGVATLLVLTGVCGVADLVSARPQERPDHIGTDLGALLEAHPEPEHTDGGWRVGGWTARLDDGSLRVDGDGAPSDWWRALACAAWEHLDAHGEAADASGLTPPS
ncbi:MAG: HAD family hydrolase [Nocardioides sp.]|nr:HAD family hydrolase [Nocardioides sp.]